MTGPQICRRGGGEAEEEEGRVLRNDIVGVAVRPQPVGERRKGLLEKVCGKRRCLFLLLRTGGSSGGGNSERRMDGWINGHIDGWTDGWGACKRSMLQLWAEF